MDWKVVARGSSPSAESVDALTGLTGLRRDEVLLALARGTLVASSGLTEHRAQILGDSLSRDPGISCRVIPDTNERSAGPRFTVLLSGFAPGYRTRLRRKLQELTGLPPEQVVVWLSRMPFALSRNVDGETARRIRNLISSAGGVVTVETEKVPASASRRAEGNAVFAPAEPSVSVPSIGTSGPALARDGGSHADIGDAASEEELPGPAEGEIRAFTEGEPPVSPIGVGSAGPPPGPRSYCTGDALEQHGPPERFTPGVPPAGPSSATAPPGPVPSRGLTSVVPHRFSFDAPSATASCLPRIVGLRDPHKTVSGPSPHVAILFPPSATVPMEMLLPRVTVLPVLSAEPEGEQGPPPVLAAVPGPGSDPTSDAPEAVPTPPVESLRHILPDPDEVEDGPPPDSGTFREPRIPLNGRPCPTAGTVSETPPVIAAAATVSDSALTPMEPGPSGTEGRTISAQLRPGRKRRRRSVMPTPPPAVHQPPPELASLHMYVCSPSHGTRDRVGSALEEVLGLPRSVANELLERCPSWVAGFRSLDKAAEVQGNLERRGVTVTLTRNLMPATSTGGEIASKGFQDWLSADG